MKFSKILTALLTCGPALIKAASQDYARHLELSILFYEAQRSGKLPANNRIFWRHDSMVDAGKDNKVDLTGGYDAGDNVKFNFPQASALTLLAWGAYKWKDGYKEAGQWDYMKDLLKWGMDYFIRCHTDKYVLYGQVGNGSLDHGAWVAPEDIDYEYPSYKITASAPGSDLAAETSASMVAASLAFRDEDPTYADTLLKHGRELYEFAEKYQGTYDKSITDAKGYYRSYSGFNDELVWGAAMLYAATGEQTYKDKVDKIWNTPYGELDPDRFLGSTGPISWDDKKAAAYALMAITTGESKYIEESTRHSDLMVNYPTTPGGLWYDTNLSMWASNRYAANAAFTVAMLATSMDANDSKRKEYVAFVKKQIDYILGDNPAKVDYVVGADPSSPKAVHHRGASGSKGADKGPDENVFILYGALAGGPGAKDNYKDARNNYEMNEVALDYNAAFQGLLAFLITEGLNVPDPKQTWDGAWPPRQPKPEITWDWKLSADEASYMAGQPEISTGDGLKCASWCFDLEVDSNISVQNMWGGKLVETKGSTYTVCSEYDNGYLDGKGTPQHWNFNFKKPNGGNGLDILPKTAIFYCNGKKNGEAYLVNTDGSGAQTYGWEAGACRPSFLCDGSAPVNTSTKTATKTKTTTTKSSSSTQTSSSYCFSEKLGYKCCKACDTIYTDESGDWGFENNDWCGIPSSCNGQQQVENDVHESGYPYCKTTTDVVYTDSVKWGIENNDWCVIKSNSGASCECWSTSQGYNCCSSTSEVVYTDESGSWGIENGDWCGIKKC
ncbi:putative cellulase [Piromyces finnis]|uniref:Endoglucanase n=1 Tax=Piromyces finnis TaxID=1754191 RepID=A0A1Y1UUT3_9FUNG|nr:putative cellulase [Piromyces finnis]|eukprot:ORX41785.1 putative cellulase [Piromyces finnis]